MLRYKALYRYASGRVEIDHIAEGRIVNNMFFSSVGAHAHDNGCSTELSVGTRQCARVIHPLVSDSPAAKRTAPEAECHPRRIFLLRAAAEAASAYPLR